MDEMLKQILSELKGLKSSQDATNARLDTMQADLSEVKTDLSEVKQRVLKIEITQENTIAKQINLLVEGHIGTVEKLRNLDTLTEKVDDIQDTVEVLKHIVVQK